MMTAIDSHCHLDAAEFDADRDDVIGRALRAGVSAMVIPAVEHANFGSVLELCGRHACCVPALGIHPMYVGRAQPADLDALRQLLQRERVVAVGEIGLDHFVQGLDHGRQEYFFVEQLKLAREFDLPVLLHIRRAQDDILKHLRRIRVRGGIAHAFNGSRQQAEAFIKLGFKLGFGGTMTYARARKIRGLAATLPLEALVLETDAPDMPPAWLDKGARNSPEHLPRIACVLAEIRGSEAASILASTTRNVLELMPEIPQLCT